MLQLSSLATYINNNTEWFREGVRGYVIDCLQAPFVSINHYQKIFCLVVVDIFTGLFMFSITSDKSRILIPA
jgi:hypothetical protein